MYDHTKQYRCSIIRGKSQKEMDDLLPAYAKVIDEVCPCLIEEFEQQFNNSLAHYLPESSRIKKTLDNHRTEISGKLFGMYYIAEDGMVYESERTKKFLADNDQPAFFKDICYKMQFPNGMQKSNTLQDRIENKINIRPNSFVLKVLQYAKNAGMALSKKDIGYYVLNSLDVLQGNTDPLEVITTIQDDKGNGIQRDILVPGKASSYTHQHINEQINYLELANLIIVDTDGQVHINHRETDAISIFTEQVDKSPAFDVYSYDLSTVESRKVFQFDWDYYFSKISDKVDSFETTAAALGVPTDEKEHDKKKGVNLVAFGDEGEEFVYKYEKQRVSDFSFRLANKVLSLGKQKGLGYDIQSVIAESGEFAEFVKYIEVKSTKRITAPDMNDSLWIDTLNVTRNEWIAAQQHKEFYSIFRVYFVRGSIIMFVLTNVAEKYKDSTIQVTPTTYRVDFGNSAVDCVILPQFA